MRLRPSYTLATPGIFRSGSVVAVSVVAMFLIFVCDYATPAEIRLHVLYVFPVAAIALHCKQRSAIVAGFLLSVLLQVTNSLLGGVAGGPLVTDVIVAIASSFLTIYLARAARTSHLNAIRLGETDWLTGLQNRRSFEKVAEAEIAMQRRYGGGFSLAMIDLNDFKLLNDTRGHHEGDRALKLVAEVLTATTRESDLVTRLGGDEFAILLPQTDKDGCTWLCKHLSKKIADRLALAGYSVTASIGGATFSMPPNTIGEALEQADKNLYLDKQRIKARAVVQLARERGRTASPSD
jgi:diguanylate cyclase (GGDEF)-like protein